MHVVVVGGGIVGLGVARALRADGHGVTGQVHVLNAPSPAATSALEIARRIADRLAKVTPG